MLLSSWLAVAAPPNPEVADAPDGGVTGRIVLTADVDRVRAVLADVDALSTDDQLSVRAEPSGRCQRVERRTRGLWRSLTLRSLRCPTEHGFEETHEPGDDFRAYASSWEVVPVEGGAEVRHRVLTEPDLPVPAAAVRKHTRASVRALLVQLAERVGSADRAGG